ncbi:MAG TPA: CCA tRNA nucleotidyltransferase [Frankiaceae bacterium]|nr:CCA tRNA nucleotidyltransferase [Frankiaceae bacterium]
MSRFRLDDPADASARAIRSLLQVPTAADELGSRFASAGHQLYLVGGTVRDALLGRSGIVDYDFATDARPDQVLALVQGWAEAVWDIGIAFGTIGLQRAGVRYEITTYRSEAYDRTSRNPEVSYGDSLDDDLRRRDFTINAMAVSVPDHEFVDLFGGLGDLGRKVLRTPATPEASFDDDPLRILRAARFVAQLGLTPDEDLVAAMRSRADRISIVAAERVRDELGKMLLASDPVAGLTLLVDTGVAAEILPELPALRMEIDEHHQHKDVYAHSLAVLRNAMALEDRLGGADLEVRVAALLHDIGKPRTRAHLPGGGVSFHHHEVVGASMTKKRLKALHFPKAFVEDVARLVELHLRFHGYARGEWTDSAVRRYVTDAGPLLERLHVLVRSDCTTRNRRKAAALARTYDDLETRIGVLLAEEDLKKVRPDLNGEEIMALLGVPPGPVVGQAWRYLKDLRLDEGPLDHDDAVARLLAWAEKQGITSRSG